MAIVLVVAIAYGTPFRFGRNSTTTGEYQIGLCQRIWRYIYADSLNILQQSLIFLVILQNFIRYGGNQKEFAEHQDWLWKAIEW